VRQWKSITCLAIDEEAAMNARRWIPMFAALALVAGACGSDDSAEVVYSPEELGTALLSPDDIGSGWTEDQRLVTDTRPDEFPALDPGMWCPTAADVPDDLLALVPDGVAFVELKAGDPGAPPNSESGRSFHGVSEQLWSSSDAEAFVETAAAGFETCTGETWEVDDGTTASVTALPGDDVGDDSTTALVTYVTPAPDGDYAWRGRQLVARFGATVMTLQELDVQLVENEPTFTDTEWQRIVDTAANQVAALSDQ
jgi:hypothetical protein